MSTSTSMRRNMSIKRSIQNHNLAYLFPIDFIFVFCSLEFLSYSYRCSSPPFFPHTILLITHTNIDRKQIEREVCCSPNPVLSQYSVWSRSPMNHLEWHTFWKMIILSFYICFSSLLPWNPLLWTEKLLPRATDKMEHTIVFNNPVHLFSLNFLWSLSLSPKSIIEVLCSTMSISWKRQSLLESNNSKKWENKTFSCDISQVFSVLNPFNRYPVVRHTVHLAISAILPCFPIVVH